MSLKKLASDAVVIVFISFSFLAGLELLLRFAFPEKVDEPSEPIELAYEFNERYLVSLKPNMQKTFTRTAENGGDTIQWGTNKNAFRGAELKQKPQERIIVYGDSNVQARFSSLENTYVSKLEKYLRANGIPGIEVVNAGTVGFGPDQSLLRFEMEADLYKPNMVIFHIFADNDFGDIVRNRLFELDKENRLAETVHERTIDERLVQDKTFSDHIATLLVIRAAKKAAGSLGLQNETTGADDKSIQTAEERFAAIQQLIEEEYYVYSKSRPRSFSHFADHYDLDIA